MTKLRDPVTYEDALIRIAAQIGWDAMSVALGKAERTVRDYSDPDTPTGIALADAELLDAAYRRAGGEGSPLGDVYRRRVEARESNFVDRDCLAEATVNVIRESGEANAALVTLLKPGASDADRKHAARELAESIDASTSTLARLTSGAGPSGSDGRAAPEGGVTA